MASDTDLKDKINTVIEPWRESSTKPPFTHEQLIVMAIVLGGGELTSRQIIQREVATFRYYREMMFDYFWVQYQSGAKKCPDVDDSVRTASAHIEGHDSALYSFEPPITEIEDKDRDGSRWNTTTSAARIFLGNLTAVKPPEVFRFFDLPAELRARIYEMVFRFPPGGIKLKFDLLDGNMTAHAPSRESSADSLTPIIFYSKRGFKIRNFKHYLDPLLVSKQLFQESVHCFYSLNTFVCEGTGDLRLAIQRLAPSRRQYLRYIVFGYGTPYGWPQLQRIMDTIVSLPQLQKLTIFVTEGWFTPSNRSYRRDPHDDMHEFNVPGLHALRSMRHRTEITLHGNCAKFAAYFKAEPIVQPEGDELKSRIGEEDEAGAVESES